MTTDNRAAPTRRRDRPARHDAAGRRADRRSPLPSEPAERALFLRLLGWAMLRALGWILLAEAVAGAVAALAALQTAPDAAGLGDLVLGGPRSPGAAALPTLTPLLLVGILGVLLRATAEAGVQATGVRTSLRVRARLRRAHLAPRLAATPSVPEDVGRDAVLLTHGLDGLEGQHTQVLPALAAAAVVPATLIVWTALRDPLSALVLVLTLPLVPAFMILIGRHTQGRIEEAAAGLDRLSAHLAELARGLPVLVGLRRAGAQRSALEEAARRHRLATMDTLRTAFVSGMALELIASLSVAVTAVLIGVRLVEGGLTLQAGLTVLVLAGEVYLPLRELGSAYHAAEDGRHARRRIEQAPAPAPSWAGRLRVPPEGPNVVAAVQGVIVRHGKGTEPVRCPDVRLAPGQARVLDGASGSGKSTLLDLLGGRLRAEAVTATGPLVLPPPECVWWVGQHPQFAAETVREELVRAGARRPVAEVAALHAAALPELLDHLVHELSPGQRRRLALARLLVALDAAAGASASTGTAHLVLLDEPTAHLDEASARRVRATVTAMAEGSVPGLNLPPVAVLAASHDPLLFSAAGAARDGAREDGTPPGPGPADASVRRAASVPEAAAAGVVAHADPVDAGSTDARPALRTVARLLPRPALLAGPVAWGAATHLSAALLAGLSGWLIVQAGWQPPILHLLSVIVLVRAAGLSRAVCRYRERLATHAAVLDWADGLRLRLWDALGERVVDFARLTRGGGALAALVADVDAVRDAAARVLVPVPAALTATGGGLMLIAALAPELLPAVLVPALLGVFLVPSVVVFGGAAGGARAGEHRAELLTVLVRELRAGADTAGLHRVSTALERIDAVDRRAARPARRAALAVGAGRASAVLAAGAAGLTAAWTAHLHGLDAAVTAFVVVLALSWTEPFAALGAAAAQAPVLWHRTRDAARMLRPSTGPGPGGHVDTAPPASPGVGTGTRAPQDHVVQVYLRGVHAGYADGPDVLQGVDLTARRGDRVVVTGSSGSGKSTLLAVLLGFLRPRAGRYTLLTEECADSSTGSAAVIPPCRLLSRVAWTPQEALVFDSTVRGNLALARPRHDPPSEQRMRRCLALVGLDEWLAACPEGLDTRVGAEGGRLSGGQRQRLAVARCLVAGADVVLLDEPTAHLGRDEGHDLLEQLRVGLADTVCVVVTHDAALAGSADQRFELPASSQGRNRRVSPGSTK